MKYRITIINAVIITLVIEAITGFGPLWVWQNLVAFAVLSVTSVLTRAWEIENYDHEG